MHGGYGLRGLSRRYFLAYVYFHVNGLLVGVYVYMQVHVRVRVSARIILCLCTLI